MRQRWIRGRNEDVVLTLEEAPARLTVRTDTAGAEVEIEGVGRAEDRIERSLRPGTYVARLWIERESRAHAEVHLRPGEQRVLELRPDPRRSRAWIGVVVGVVAVGLAVGLGVGLAPDRVDAPANTGGVPPRAIP